MNAPLNPRQMSRFEGFGQSVYADGYHMVAHTPEDVAGILALARSSGRTIAQRGLGRSYGDPAMAAEQIVLDSSSMSGILAFNPESGVLQAKAGTGLREIWQHTLPLGWWPPVVTGTQHVTLGGAIAMNVHGKNQFCTGALIAHLLEIEFMTPTGDTRTLRPTDAAWEAIVGGTGLLGVILSATLQLKSVGKGSVKVTPLVAQSWADQFAIFADHAPTADYLVSWIDAFSNGRGVVHRADYDPDHDAPQSKSASSLTPHVWKVLKLASRRGPLRLVNSAKQFLAKREATKYESLPEYSFLLDAIPNWHRAYAPHGFLQFQPFVPKANAKAVFGELFSMQQSAGRESFLAVLKQHRPDPGLLSPYLDGFSLAMDFPMTASPTKLLTMLHQMVELVIDAGGRFYLAKDQILTAAEFARCVPLERLAKFRAMRSQMDPDRILRSSLSDRLNLT